MSIQQEEESFDVGLNQYVAYEVDQGDLAVAETQIGHSLLEEFGKTWATPLLEGQLVKMTSVNNRVIRAALSDQVVLGFAAHKPVPGDAIKHVPDDDSSSPYSDIIFTVDVEIFGDFQREVPRDSGTAPVLAESIINGGSTLGSFVGKSSLTNTNFVTGFTATDIVAIWGYWGKLDI